MNLYPVHTPDEIIQVATLAQTIWQEFYTPIIGEAQVQYMLEHFQSVDAMTRQITEEEFQYYRMGDVGYFSIQIQGEILFLSKIYFLASHRRKGLGKKAMEQIETLAQQASCRCIELTVNKYNPSITAYERMGFQREESIITDIGGGFVMDDFRMHKVLTSDRRTIMIEEHSQS